jgi:dihydrofolate reductase
MKISIIAAIGENRELGKHKQLLWHIPQDLAHFKKLTNGHPVIMGRTTYESIGKPLPGRLNIIITRQADIKIPGCSITHSIEEAIAIASKHDTQEIFVIGGGQIYDQALKFTDKLYLTIVHGKFEADTYFPDYSEFKKIIKKEELQTTEYQLTFLELSK